ncbi:MAG TPA: flagellar hook protein FlgE [Dissulfurispiraceae bacterium]|nr:flagellar hook protein FlgE [Dissulfurispiraceae bacterium]
MGIMSSLCTSVSGLGANGMLLSIIGDNIANANTTGFKGSRGSFGDILSQTLGGGTSFQIGRGANLQGVQGMFTQGTIETTANPLDLAIEGDGFFIVQSPDGGNFYTRAGQFSIDKDGNIVNPDGMLLQGYLTQEGGVMGRINVSSINSLPNPSDQITISANLNSDDPLPIDPFDVADPVNTSNFSTSISVYDSLGNSHLVNIYFRKSAEAATGNSWEWFAVVSAADSESGNTEIQAQGTLTFDTNGALTDETVPTYPTGGFDFGGGVTQDQQIAFDFGRSIAEGGSGVTGTTQFGSSNSVLFQSQNGFSAGSIQSIVVDQDGIMTGIFSNGQTMEIAKVALARFIAPTELAKMGKNLFGESAASGVPIVGTAGTSGRGKVMASALESSNVDLADEFVKLIAAQRGFQANTRVITTTDDLLAELMAIKR